MSVEALEATGEEAHAGEGERDSRIALVDIGSNSIRLVVYDGLKRAPEVLFNEKVMCGLGRSLRSSGRLHPEGVGQALRNLVRFSRLARAMGVEDRVLLATAAVREAEDSEDFVAKVECIAPDQRVWVLLDLMGRTTRLAVDAGAVRAV